MSPTLGACELSHLERVPIDIDRARAEHDAYRAALAAAGCRLAEVPPAPGQPDAVFVEDTVVVTDEVAVLGRPGTSSRRPEVEAVAEFMAELRPVERIRAPATLEGGDVLRAGDTVFVGATARTDLEGARQLAAILEPLGYRVVRVPVRGCLHLKTAVTAVADDAVLLNPAWVDPGIFSGWRRIEVHPDEPFAANALRVGDTLVMAAGHPRTRGRLDRLGLTVVEVDVTELAKAEAGVTCCSVLVADPEERR